MPLTYDGALIPGSSNANLTPLSTILNEMDRWQSVSRVEEQYKVRDLDSAIKIFRRKFQFPWTLKKTSLRVFSDVLEYPVQDDHDELAFFDNNKKGWFNKPRPKYTSIEEFYHDPQNSELFAEIWNQGSRFLGFRYKQVDRSSTLLNGAETLADWSVSGDATAVARDTVFFKEGSSSVRVSVTNSAGTATIRNTISTTSDTLYTRKYHFKWVYFTTAPTSVELRLETDTSNYIKTTGIATQFNGAPFQASAWNLIAHDLNLATEVGTFDETSITSEALIMTGAATGNYYIDASYLREWELLDYWYYSKYLVASSGADLPDQEYFLNSSETYTTDEQLIGDSEWVDAVKYQAMLITVGDIENQAILKQIKDLRDDAMYDLFSKYPTLSPSITTSTYNFGKDYPQTYNYYTR